MQHKDEPENSSFFRGRAPERRMPNCCTCYLNLGIYFEAVSHYFLDILSPNLTVEFAKLQFELIKEENYSKTVKDENWKTIISDVQNIFTNIYKVNYEKTFEIIDDIEYNKKENAMYSPNATGHAIQNTVSEQRPNWKAIFLGLGALIFLYFVFIKENGTDSSQDTYDESYLENSLETQLAIINDNSKTPQQITLNLFSDLLTSLNNRYPNTTKQQIANALVAAHNIVVKNGGTETLLEFSTGFNAYSKEIDPNFGLKLEENLALFLKFGYQL